MATKTKSAAKKATKAKATDKTDKRTDASARRSRGGLEALVKDITDAYEKDESSANLPEGKTLTPHRIAQMIGEMKGEDTPSSGAVAAILKRWEEYGYALTHDKPYAFRRTSAAGQKQGLDALKEKHRDKLKAERAAAKASKES